MTSAERMIMMAQYAGSGQALVDHAMSLFVVVGGSFIVVLAGFALMIAVYNELADKLYQLEQKRKSKIEKKDKDV